MIIYSDVCIVGAGPGGALLGYILAKNNISTVVIEKNAKIDKAFRGEHLNETGEHILKKYDLYQLVEELGLLLMKRIEYWDQGAPFKTIFPDSEHGHVGIHVPQNHLLSVLTNEAMKFPNYRLLMNTSVHDLIQDSNGRYTGVKGAMNEEEVEVHASLIIGADGRFSTVRKLAGIPYSIRKHGFDLLWAKIPAPEGWEPTIRNAIVDGMQLALFTQANGFIQIGWNIKEGSYQEIRKSSLEPYIQKLVGQFPQLHDTVGKHIQSWEDIVPLSVFSSNTDEWIKDSLIIIGDAAHTLTPTGAFGINCSLKDADMLAEQIIRLQDLKNCSSMDFQTFQELRKQETDSFQEQQLKKEATFMENFLALH